MRHKFDFYSPPPGEVLHFSFSWDDETGELSGDGVDVVRQWADEAVGAGTIVCADIEGEIPATDPLRVKAEFCALVGREVLPEALKPFYPTVEYPGFVAFSDVEADVVSPDIEVIY